MIIVETATIRLVVSALPIDITSLASGDTNECHAARYHCRLKCCGGKSSVSDALNDMVIIVRIGRAARNSTIAASRLDILPSWPGIVAGSRHVREAVRVLMLAAPLRSA